MQNFDGSVYLNGKRRSVRCPGVLGAFVRGGAEKPSYMSGVGDCLLIDFGRAFFAVSDSSDRNSSASRFLLRQYADLLDTFTILKSKEIHTREKAEKIKLELVRKSEELLCTMPFSDSCTFTGFLILRTAEGLKGLLMHTGDSLMMVYHPAEGSLRQVTKSNFWMVGRTRQFFQVETMSIEEGMRFILATDGFSGLDAPRGQERNIFFQDLFENGPIEEIPDILMDRYDKPHPGKDDLGVIILDPRRLPFDHPWIILGGTSSHDEKTFREGRKTGLFEDRYHPPDHLYESLFCLQQYSEE